MAEVTNTNSGATAGERDSFARTLSHASFDKTIWFEVDHASFTVKQKQGAKKILDDVTVRVKGGTSLALMGPSGAGKSTILQLASMSLRGGTIEGKVTLNKQSMTNELFRKYAAFVEQYDTHWAFLTCQEIMDYMARLCVPGDKAVRAKEVDNVMTNLGLNECAGTKVGNDFFKGISGGQKKRLSIAMSLLKQPAMLLLDEPTSGLDAASAASVMDFLVKLAAKANMVVMATIHQPAVNVFMSFSSVLFMANGRTAYYGAPSEVHGHCESIGRPLPPLTNPADHFMVLINSEFQGREEVDKVVGAWRSVPPGCETSDSLVPRRGVGLRSRCQVLLRRMVLLSFRDPTLYIGRMMVFILCNSFFALVYIDSRSTELDNATPRFFYTNWLGAVPSMFCIVVVYALNEEFQIIRKEVKNGMVPIGAYFLANFLLQVPYMVLLAFFAVVFPAYAMMGYPTSNSVPFVLVHASMIWSFECIGQLLAVAFRNPLIGMLAAVGLWFTNFLFAGIFLKPEAIVQPLRLICYVSPLRWCYHSLHYLAFHGTTWTGGASGEQMLDSLSSQFAVEADVQVHEDILYILAFGAVFKVCFFAVLMLQARRA